MYGKSILYISLCAYIYMYIVYNLRGIYVHCIYVCSYAGRESIIEN